MVGLGLKAYALLSFARKAKFVEKVQQTICLSLVGWRVSFGTRRVRAALYWGPKLLETQPDVAPLRRI
jgi:hypothetical protein